MQCRNCGTDIADKALICYRCGTPTTEARHKPYVAPPTAGPPSIVWVVLGAALVAVLAWFLLNS